MKMGFVGALAATAFTLGACETDMVADKTGHEVLRFTWNTYCMTADTWDNEILEEQAGRSPMTYFNRPQTWADTWVRRLDGVAGNSENPQAYVDYLVEHRRNAGLADLPGYPSAGVFSAYDCNDHFRVRQGTAIVGGMADWTRQPTLSQVRAVFPAAAVAAQRDGVVELNCAVQPGGKLGDCQVAKEAPAGMGFAAAALKLAPDYRVQLWRRDRSQALPSRISRRVDFPVHECLPQREAHYGRPCGSASPAAG
jgi:hypothetical protein